MIPLRKYDEAVSSIVVLLGNHGRILNELRVCTTRVDI